jgi:hypothetical protein
MSYQSLLLSLKGGSGSGNHGHQGIPGHVGGSAGGSGVAQGVIEGFNIDSKTGITRPVVSVNGDLTIVKLPGPGVRMIYNADGTRKYDLMSSVSSQKARGRGSLIEHTDFEKFKKDLLKRKYIDPKDIDALNNYMEDALK